MTYDEMIEVLEAAKAGKTIELTWIGGDDWSEIDEPSWNFDKYIYRVKAEPFFTRWDILPDWVQYVAMDDDGDICGYSNRPIHGSHYWNCDSRYSRLTINPALFNLSLDWKDTLTKRPDNDQ